MIDLMRQFTGAGFDNQNLRILREDLKRIKNERLIEFRSRYRDTKQTILELLLILDNQRLQLPKATDEEEFINYLADVSNTVDVIYSVLKEKPLEVSQG